MGTYNHLLTVASIGLGKTRMQIAESVAVQKGIPVAIPQVSPPQVNFLIGVKLLTHQRYLL